MIITPSLSLHQFPSFLSVVDIYVGHIRILRLMTKLMLEQLPILTLNLIYCIKEVSVHNNIL